MSAMLLFPPQWNPFQPYLSLPCLTAYLRERGCSVDQRDLNVEVYDLLLSEDELQRLLPDILERFTRLSRRQALSATEQKPYLDLSWTVHTDPLEVISRIEEAKDFLRNKECYHDFERYLETMRLIKQALRFVSSAYSPTEIGLGSCRIGSTALCIDEVIAMTSDDRQNPFLRLLREKIVPSIVMCQPRLVGISVAGVSQIIPALTIARLIKESFRETHITLGGNALSRFADAYGRDSGIFGYTDSIVLFEGEEALFQLYRQLHGDRDLAQVPNLVYKVEGQGVVCNRIGANLGINTLPTPDFDGLPLRRYLVPEPVLPVYATRGCYWSECTFCDIHYGHRFHMRKANTILNDLRKLQRKHGTRYFHFVDECLLPATLKELVGRVEAAGLELFWGTQMRFEPVLSQEMAERLFQSGCRVLFFGLESGSEKVLNDMQKGTDISTSMDILRHTHQAGILNRVSIIVGFPTETLDDFNQTMSLLLQNQTNIDMVDVSEFILKRYAPIMNNLTRFGIEFHPREVSDLCYHYHFEDYTMRYGLLPARIEELVQVAKQTIDSKFLLNSLQHLVPIEHLMFFLSLWGNIRSFRVYLDTIAPSRDYLKVKVIEQPHRSVKLKKRAGVYVRTFDYNLQEIVTALNENRDNIPPRKSAFILNTSKGSIIPVSEPGRDILDLCDGQNTLETIIERTTTKRPGLDSSDCVGFILDVISKDILAIAKE